MLQVSSHSIESRTSWAVAGAAVIIISLAFGGPWILNVALKNIAAELGGARSVPGLAVLVTWLGTAVGGIIMGPVAARVGVRWTAICGAVCGAAGLALATTGLGWQLFTGYGLLVGCFGIGAINAPLYIYISRWFDHRRGSALALISSGGYVAGALWPPIFEQMIAGIGWRRTMLSYAAIELAIIIPLALVFLRTPPEAMPVAGASFKSERARVLGWPSNAVFAILCAAIFLCCATMSMPQGHLVALCSDLGISASRGAAMLTVLLGTAVVTRQVWGLIADRLGGLRTVLISSAAQCSAMAAFMMTQNEVGLFAVSAAFGVGFSGLVPANVLAIRELFPPAEASWRIPLLLFCSSSGMGTGVWLAGVLYDHFGYYAPAFAAGIGLNTLNFILIATLVWRQTAVWARAPA